MNPNMHPLQIGDKVRHKDKEVDRKYGSMTIYEIRNAIAICGPMDYERIGSKLMNFPVNELEKKE